MSKSKKKVITTASVKRAEPTVSKKRMASSQSNSPKPTSLIFNKDNFILMLAGIGLIGLGLVLMSGGAMPSPDVWDESIIYSFRRTVLAPLVIIIGLVIQIYAIFKNTSQTTTSTEE